MTSRQLLHRWEDSNTRPFEEASIGQTRHLGNQGLTIPDSTWRCAIGRELREWLLKRSSGSMSVE
jgi:hypothetical protein